MTDNFHRHPNADNRRSPQLPARWGSAIIFSPLFLQFQPDLLIWMLLAVIGGIILIFVLIAFILRPLSRQSGQKAAPPPPGEITQISPPAADTDTTQISPPAADTATEIIAPLEPATSDIPTDPSLPKIERPVTTPISGQRPNDIGWSIAGLSDVGLKRELNEDNLLLVEDTMGDGQPYGLYVVADGLGGHEAGEIASQITVDTVRQMIETNPPTPATAPYETWFHEIITTANTKVLQYQDGHQEAQKMGSTLVLALVTGGEAHIANVGDSRAYLLTGQEINQISVDHSLVERLVQIGQITREEARTHKQRNVVYSIIGEKRRLEIGYYHVPLAAGSRLLLCTDGLSGMITDEQILELSQNEPDPAYLSQKLVEAAKQAGGHDNITAIIVQTNDN